MKKLTSLVLGTILCHNLCFSQEVTSLKNELRTASSDTAKVRLLARLGFEYAFIHLDSARQFDHAAIDLAQQIRYTKGEADGLNNLAISYDIEGKQEVAVNYYLQALELYESIDDQKGMARIYNNCGMVYQSLGDLPKSLQFHLQSLQLEKATGDSLGIAYSMTQVASIYLHREAYDSALLHYTQAYDLLDRLHDEEGLSYVHWGLGELYLYTNKADKAIDHCQQAFSYFQRNQNKKGMSETKIILGKTYSQLKKYPEAEAHLLDALQIGEALEAKNVALECLLSLSYVYRAMSDFDLALQYYTRYTNLKDQLHKNEMTSNIEAIEGKYQFDKQQQKIALLNKEKEFQAILKYAALGFSAVITFLLILLYRTYRINRKALSVLKAKNKEIEKKNILIELEKKNALEAARVKSDFLSIMSHEIRTPMNVVIGFIHLLLDENPRPEQIESLKMLKLSADNLLRLLNDILDLTKLESGKFEIESIPFDLDHLIQGMAKGHGMQAEAKGLDFILQVDPEIPQHLIGDPGRLSQVLNNLLCNAIKFTAQGQVKLRINLVKKGKKKVHLKFIVSDTGIGISEDKKESIFENFMQAETHTARKYGGSGLGLSITKHIIYLMGSSIQLESNVNKGSRFSFQLAFRMDRQLQPH